MNGAPVVSCTRDGSAAHPATSGIEHGRLCRERSEQIAGLLEEQARLLESVLELTCPATGICRGPNHQWHCTSRDVVGRGPKVACNLNVTVQRGRGSNLYTHNLDAWWWHLARTARMANLMTVMYPDNVP